MESVFLEEWVYNPMVLWSTVVECENDGFLGARPRFLSDGQEILVLNGCISLCFEVLQVLAKLIH